ncbi:hypothetical protein M0R72_06125 [Candidatus Pacearchaeota archaeon]|jgi:hypothetical protein|nr:hypothetical protein [Candidatus Pacearchaeota archaeon]
MRLQRITATPQTIHDKSSVSATAYLDEDVSGVLVDFFISSPLPSFGQDAIKVASGTTDASGIASIEFVMDKSLHASVIDNATSIGADLPFSLGLAGSAKSISLVAHVPTLDDGVSCALLYDANGALPEGGAVAGEGSVSSGGAGQIVIPESQLLGASAPTGAAVGGSSNYTIPAIVLVVVVLALLLLIWKKYR